jgi:hypothetical protein
VRSGVADKDEVGLLAALESLSSTPTRAATDALNESDLGMSGDAERRLQLIIDDALRYSPGDVYTEMANEVVRLRAQLYLARLSSSPSSTTATPATGCLTPSDCEYASQGWCPRCEKPALPSSRALSEEERKALDWVIRDIEPTTLYEIDECNADEASAMYAVANTLRGLRDRLTGAPK